MYGKRKAILHIPQFGIVHVGWTFPIMAALEIVLSSGPYAVAPCVMVKTTSFALARPRI